ncbi:MAG: DUF5691 domain-containing protein [Ferruginibacter sp.]
MEYWNNIINTAMIGTDKKMISENELPSALTEAVSLIQLNNWIDKEEKFLQIAALALNYRQAGVQPLHKETVSLQQSLAEEKPYCSKSALRALKDIQSEDSIPLLKFWLQQAEAKGQLVHPEMIPSLLSAGVQTKSLQILVAACCGKRGEWLSRFNESWNFSQNQTTEQLWQTGSPEQRRTILRQTRTNDPSLARAWLQQTWAQEDANTKASFLEIFVINISEADISFLESVSTEKSKKVKEEALCLLKKIPLSAVVQLYQRALQQSVELKKEKVLMGLSSKLVLKFHFPPTVDEAIFKTGIEKLSNDKAFTDDEFIISQLIRSVPPTFWQTHFSAGPQTVIDLFQKDNVGKKMMPSLVIATSTFKDTNWALSLAQHSEVFYLETLPLLPLQQQEHFSNKFFAQFPDSIIQSAVQRETAWSMELTKNIFRYIAKNPYNFTRSFFSQYIHLIPALIIAELEKCTPPEEHLRTIWVNTSEYIIKLITLKVQTLKAFHE